MVLIAGCSGGGPTTYPPPGATATSTEEAPTPTVPETTAEPPSPTEAPTPTETEPPTEVATKTNEPDGSALTVYLNDTTDSSRDYGPVVASAVEYWNDERIGRFAAYEAELAYDGSAVEGDFEVRVVDELRRCGDDGDVHETLGCAPLVVAQPESTVTIEVRSGQTDAKFENTLKHELGHVLGITHDEPPTWLMAGGAGENPAGSVPNATERDHPWNHSGDIRVAVRDGVEGAATVKANVRVAVRHYNKLAGLYLPEGTRVVLVDEWYRADIVFQDEPPGSFAAANGSGSIAYRSGLDYDSDPSLEQWLAVYVYLAEVDPAETEPHAGYWIGIFAGNSPEELPAKYEIENESAG